MKHIILLFALVSTQAFAQKSRDNVEQFNAWAAYTGTNKLSGKLDVYTEFQFRRNGFYEKPLQIQLRTALDIKINDFFTASPAYVYTVSYPYGKQPSTNYSFVEHRPFEQFVTKNSIGRFKITHRYRLEQRFIETKLLDTNKEYVFDKWLYKNRLRYRILANIPINKPTMKDAKTLFIQASNELFINFGKNVAKNIFDQNRAFIGLGYKVSSPLTITGGYLMQQLFKGDGIKVENNHTLFINVNYNLDFSKKENTKIPLLK